MDLLESRGGGNSLSELSKQLGVGGSDTRNLVDALAPALMRGLQKQTENRTSLDGLTRAIDSGTHQRYIDEPNLLAEEATRIDGNKILGHIFGSKDVSRNVAAQASQTTGIESTLIKKALPILAGLAMGALSKSRQSGADADGGLGGLLGGLLGGGSDGAGNDDILDIAKKLF